MVYQGEIVYLVYITKYQPLLLEQIQGVSEGFGEEVSDPTIRATIMYLLLKIVSVLNVKDGISKSMCIAQVTDVSYQ